MCGIVGCGGAYLSETALDIFEQLLHADVVRGDHATGVYRDDGNGGTMLFKKALPSPKFLELPGWQMLRGERLTQYQITTLKNANKFIPIPVSPFYVGHNRWATRGAADNDEYAHPFKVGDVTLVHNGSLTNQGRLPDSKDFVVDSHNIAHSINVQGIDETIQNLQGAFTLVWHDARDQTLNFIRNSQRPLYMVKTTAGVWYWASEKDMLLWILNRQKVKPTIAEEFELAPGTQIRFDVSGGKFTRLEDKTHTFPSFYTATSQTNWSGRANWWDDDDYSFDYHGYANQGRTQTTTQRTTQRQTSSQTSSVRDASNKVLEEYKVGFSMGDRIEVYPSTFEHYNVAQSPYGTMYATAFSEGDNGSFIEVIQHGVTQEIFDKYEAAMYGTVIGYRIVDREKVVARNETVTEKELVIIVSSVTVEKNDPSVTPDNVVPINSKPKKDNPFSQKHVGKMVSVTTDTCGFPKDWAGTVLAVEKDYLTVSFPGYGAEDKDEEIVDIHFENLELSEGEEEVDADDAPFLDSPANFHSSLAKVLTDLEKESDIQDGIFTEILDQEDEEAFSVEEDSDLNDAITLADGLFVTRAQWLSSNHLHSCGICSNFIEFDIADACARHKNATICPDCDLTTEEGNQDGI